MDKESYIYFVPIPLPLIEHKRVCRFLGGTVATPINGEESRELNEDSITWFSRCSVNPYDTCTWLGATDSQEEGVWKDFLGFEILLTNWSLIEPNGVTEENCAAIRYNQLHFSTWWIDVKCFESEMCSSCRINTFPIFTLKGLSKDAYTMDFEYVLPKQMDGHLNLRGFSETDITYIGNNTYAMHTFDETFALLHGSHENFIPLGRQLWNLDGSERILLISSCLQEEFSCDNGQCVPIQVRCDDVQNCVDGSDEDSCFLLEVPKNYKKYLPPPPTVLYRKYEMAILDSVDLAKVRPLPLHVEIDISRILKLDLMKMEISIEFHLMLLWKDSRLKYFNLAQDVYKNRASLPELNSIWIPEVG